MPGSTGLFVFIAALLRCVSGDVLIVSPGVTIELTCTGPTLNWFWNGRQAVTAGDCYESRLKTSEGQNTTATLTINGNHTCGTFNVYCIIHGSVVGLHNRTLAFQGHLPSPENVYVNESTIGWKPPYSAMNNGFMHLDPHITQYTVYITDNYTGNIIVRENVTETQFTFDTSDSSLCPMYQVSAWNGCQGNLSEPMKDSIPRVPRRIAAESITVELAVESDTLHIHIDNVDTVCISRMPEFFLVTLIGSDGVMKNSNKMHEPGRVVADFTIRLSPNLDMCSLHVNFSAGNSAGMSAPTQITVGCSRSSTDSTTAHASTTVSTATRAESGGGNNRQQGFNTTLIVTIIGVIAAIVGALIAIATVGYICYRKYKRRNSKDPSDQTDHYYSKSPSLDKPKVSEADYEQTTSRQVPVPRRTQSSDSTESTSSAGSGRSDDPLLPPSPPAQAGSPRKGMYTEVDPVKQTRVQPPANDDPVLYSQIKHQD